MKTFLIAAMTADGFIARDETQTSLEWTSPEDKKLYVAATKEAGVMVMGSHTFDTIGRGLPGRKTVLYTSRPADYAGIEGVETTDEEPAALLRRLAAEGYEQVAICGGAVVYWTFVAAGVVDEIRLTVEPVLFGHGIKLFDGPLDAKLKLREVKHLNENSLQLIYSVDNDT
nr:RibD C-terminal domain protein [uncultured bacterium]